MGRFLGHFSLTFTASVIALIGGVGAHLCFIRLGCVSSQHVTIPTSTFDFAEATKLLALSKRNSHKSKREPGFDSWSDGKRNEEPPTCQTAGSELPGVGDAFSKEDFCTTRSPEEYAAALSEQRLKRGPSGRPTLGDGEVLLESLQEEADAIDGSGLWAGQNMGTYAMMSFEQIRQYEAWDVLSFRETWTDEDTVLLLQLLRDEQQSLGLGNLTTEIIVDMLPSFQDLQTLIDTGHIAIVGNGDALDGFGQEIDQHPVVARFSNLIGDALQPENTGTKLDIHVFNVQVEPPEEPEVLQMDLESILLWTSYCKRMKSHGRFVEKSRKILMFRPSAFCAFDENMKGFTRGFLFFWFVGSLFNHTDMYGFEGVGHYSKTTDAMSALPVLEPFLEFEHRLYEKALELKDA